MKRILAASAMAMLLSTPAFADAHMGMFYKQAEGEKQILGSEFIGARVYVAENEFDDDYRYEAGAEKEWDDVGEINNIVLSRDGMVKAVIIGVGGFLGIGEKDVAVNMDKIRIVSDGPDANDYFLVFTASKAMLDNAPDWDRAEYRERLQRVERKREEREADMESLERNAMMYKADDSLFDGIDAEGYEYVKADVVTRDNLIGSTVYSIKNDDIGEVEDLRGSGSKLFAVLEVGGFLDIGDKHVAVPLDKLRVMRKAGDEDLRVYVAATEEQLEELPDVDR